MSITGVRDWRKLCIGLIGLSIANTALGQQKQVETVQITVRDLEKFLRDEAQLSELRKTVSSMKQAPLYLRLSLAELLVDSLRDEAKATAITYEWKKGTHDRGRVAGRAAWALEQIIGKELKVVRPTTSAPQLGLVRDEAVRLVRSYRSRALRIRSGSEPSPDALKISYANKINPGISGELARKSSKAMNRLLSEWCPIGKRLSDLESIVGKPARVSVDKVYYRFDSGYGGVDYRFKVKKGVIESVLLFGRY